MTKRAWLASFLIVTTLGCAGTPEFVWEEKEAPSERDRRKAAAEDRRRHTEMKKELARRLGVLATQPSSADAHHKVAIQYYRLYKARGEEKTAQKAEENWQKALSLDPKHYKALYNLGVLMHRKKKATDAVAYWEKAAKVEPRFYRANYNIGTYYHNLGLQHQEAAQEMKKRADPKAAAEKKKANEYFELAVDFYKKTLRYKANHIKSFINLGLVYFELYRDKEMIAAWKDGLKLAPNDILLNYNTGIYYAGQVADWGAVPWKKQDKKDRERIKLAVSHWKRAVDNNAPATANVRWLAKVHYGLGEFYDGTGDTDRALRHMKRAYEYDPTSAKIRHRASALARKKRLGR